MQGLFNGKTKLTFLGLDFTQAKFIGDATAFSNPSAIETQMIPSWNSLLVLEPKKFALDKAFKLSGDRYETYIDDIASVNKKVKVDQNISSEAYEINEATVAKSVASYKLSKNEGIGVVYVVETLDKPAEKMTVWVTFIDMSSSKVLHTEKVIAKPAGFGFRNYWAGAVANVGKQISSSYYKNWSNKFK
jgi:hypothetical protein